MSETSLQPQTRRWLAWEWRIALITVVGGALIATAAIVYEHFATPSPEQVEAARRAQLTAVVQTATQICTQALAAAKDYGIVPSYAGLASMFPTATQVKGRYVCAGGTNVTRYNIAVDLFCRELKNPRCVALYSVTQPDGTVLYRRRG
jgi:hypothetical protein